MLKRPFSGSCASGWANSQASRGLSRISDGGRGLPGVVQLPSLDMSSFSLCTCGVPGTALHPGREDVCPRLLGITLVTVDWPGWVTWPHLVARQAGECSLYLGAVAPWFCCHVRGREGQLKGDKALWSVGLGARHGGSQGDVKVKGWVGEGGLARPKALVSTPRLIRPSPSVRFPGLIHAASNE